MLHLLMFGEGLFDGTGCLVSNEACMVVLEYIPCDGAMDIYVEELGEEPT